MESLPHNNLETQIHFSMLVSFMFLKNLKSLDIQTYILNMIKYLEDS